MSNTESEAGAEATMADEMFEAALISTGHTWHKRGETFRHGERSVATGRLPPAIYSYGSDMMGWFLYRDRLRFEFPFKLYGNNDKMINRIQKAFLASDSSLGVLLDGLKGTGKTVVGKQIANWAVEQGYLVLVVTDPIPNVVEVLSCLEQPVVVFFDEFEKVYSKPLDQQRLLTALDGVAGNSHRRLYIFTTNQPAVDPNMLDRPSRVRYRFKFGKLEEAIVNEVVDDMLRPELAEQRPNLKKEIIQYLMTRLVLSIDVVKAVVQDVNLFEEAPSSFADIFNLSENTPSGFNLTVVDENGRTIREQARPFKPTKSNIKVLFGFLSSAGQSSFEDNWPRGCEIPASWGGQKLRLVEPTDDPTIWLCEMAVEPGDCWVRDFRGLRDRMGFDTSLWLDEKPEGWEGPPDWVRLYEDRKGLMWSTDAEDKSWSPEKLDELEKAREAHERWEYGHSVYGTHSRAKLLVKIEPTYGNPWGSDYSTRRNVTTNL